MSDDPARLSLADLIAQDVRLEPAEAATIIRDLCVLARDAPLQGSSPLTPGKVSIDSAGRLSVAPGTSSSPADLGTLLEVLIVAARRTGTTRVPAPLFYTMARAAGQVEAPPFATVEELEASVARFAVASHWRPLADLYERWSSGSANDEELHEPSSYEPSSIEMPAEPVGALRPEPMDPFAADVPAALDAVAPAGAPVLASAPITAVDLAQPAAGGERQRIEIRPVWVALVAAVGLVGGGLAAFALSGNTDVYADRAAATVATSGEERAAAVAPSAGTAPAAPAEGADAGATATAPVPLLMSRDANADAVFSPSMSGAAVFFHSDTANGSALKRADIAGDGHVSGLATILEDGAKNYHAQLSPDGQSLAFDSDREGERGVYVARADGTGARRVSGDGYAAVPRWSPDGTRLVFLRAEPDRSKVWNLWMADLGSGELTRLTRHSYGQVWAGSWFPDGTRIGYSHETRFIVLDLGRDDGQGRMTSYSSPIDGRLVRTPAVAPDGRRVILQVSRDGAWMLDLADGSMRRVLDDSTAEEFAWSPDGSRIVFHSRRNGSWGLWSAAVERQRPPIGHGSSPRH